MFQCFNVGYGLKARAWPGSQGVAREPGRGQGARAWSGPGAWSGTRGVAYKLGRGQAAGAWPCRELGRGLQNGVWPGSRGVAMQGAGAWPAKWGVANYWGVAKEPRNLETGA